MSEDFTVEEDTRKMIEMLNNVDVKIEANSRSFNTSIHVYEHATKEKIDAVIENAVYGLKKLQARIAEEMAK